MITLEQVEKLRERAGISYEEAKKALEETNGDLLEAVINLEKRNLIKPPESGGYYNSKTQKQETSVNSSQYASQEQASDDDHSDFSEMVRNFFSWCGRMIHKGNTNNFEVLKDGENVLQFPLTVLALLLIFGFWFVIPITLIGLFFGYRYRFSGPDVEKTQVNKSVETVSDAALRAVNKVVDAAENLSKDVKKNKGDKDSGENIDH